MIDSPWNSQRVGQHCIPDIVRLIYHHIVYSGNILMWLSERCDCWYQSSHCLQHFVETTVTLQAYFFQKMPELSWKPFFGTSTYQSLLLPSAGKGSTHLPLKHLRLMQKRAPPFLWPNVNSISGHKLIDKINTTHLLVAVLRRFQLWHINSFLGLFWPLLSCADRIRGYIVGGTSNNFVIQPRPYQTFTNDSKIIRSSGFLC